MDYKNFRSQPTLSEQIVSAIVFIFLIFALLFMGEILDKASIDETHGMQEEVFTSRYVNDACWEEEL